MGEYTRFFQDPREDQQVLLEDEEEMALSLCDFPIENKEEPQEGFEFFSDLSSEMSSAEDIIFCGKLVPFKEPHKQHFPPPLPFPTIHKSSEAHVEEPLKQKEASLPRRSGSLSGLNSTFTRSESAADRNKLLMTRSGSSLSLDQYHRLKRLSRITSREQQEKANKEVERSSSMRSTIGESGKMVAKPRWFVLMFGVVKPPTHGNMELKDIKNRQSRRNPSSRLPADVSSCGGGGKKHPVEPGCGKGSCRLLRVLSCKSYTSVAVESPFYVPQV